MRSHEASLGKLQRCLSLPRKLKLQWKEGKWSFPSTLGQHSSSPPLPRANRSFRGSQPLARLELGDVTTSPEVDKVSPHQFPSAGNLRV